MGDLQKCLARGEYGNLKDCPVFESNFVQVTRSGEVVNRVTMGIAASTHGLELPDLLLLARPVEYPKKKCTCKSPKPKLVPREELQLTALMPLKFVRFYVHNKKRHQFKVCLANGRNFYLQLLAHPQKLDYVFGQWVQLFYRLRFLNTDAPITFRRCPRATPVVPRPEVHPRYHPLTNTEPFSLADSSNLDLVYFFHAARDDPTKDTTKEVAAMTLWRRCFARRQAPSDRTLFHPAASSTQDPTKEKRLPSQAGSLVSNTIPACRKLRQ